jgi:hypothetical protein
MSSQTLAGSHTAVSRCRLECAAAPVEIALAGWSLDTGAVNARKPRWPVAVAAVAFVLFAVAWILYFVAFSHLAG